MRPFNRESFLLWVFAGLLAWQAGLFTFATVKCSGLDPDDYIHVCPKLGERYESFVQTTLGAVLGLLAGKAIDRDT